MPSATPLYLGIDFGTTGCRALAIDDAGRVCAEARTDLPAPRRAGAAVEQDPELWWDALWRVLDDLKARIDARRVRALAVDGTSASVLLADARGRPLGPARLYNDAHCQAQAARIREIAPADSAAHGATGSLAKLLYLREQFPRARHVLHQADWIAGRLSGRWGVSDENNALKLGYDPQARRWPAWLQALEVDPDWLPAVYPPGTPLGLLRPELAARLGCAAGVVVVAGTTDSTAAFLATGASEPGEAVTALGSTLVLKVLSTQPIFAPRYGVYSHRLGERWLVGGASNSGGAVLLRYFSRARLQAMTPLLQPQRPTGLDYYPLCGPGERFPFSDPACPPRLAPRPADDVAFFQGMLEGMARIEQQGYRLLAELGAPPPRSVRSTGGGAANPAWRAIRQALLGVPFPPAAHTEAAYGSALLARRGAAFNTPP